MRANEKMRRVRDRKGELQLLWGKGRDGHLIHGKQFLVLGLGKNSVWILPYKMDTCVCLLYIHIYILSPQSHSPLTTPLPRPGCALTKAVTIWRDKRGANRFEGGGGGEIAILGERNGDMWGRRSAWKENIKGKNGKKW